MARGHRCQVPTYKQELGSDVLRGKHWSGTVFLILDFISTTRPAWRRFWDQEICHARQKKRGTDSLSQATPTGILNGVILYATLN